MNKISFKKIIGLSILIISLNSIVAFAKENPNGVHFIDSGKSDIVLIKTVDYNMLIDTGDKEHAKNNIDYLKSQGVSKIQDIIITHHHDDNYGGLEEILKEFKVSRILLPECYLNTEERKTVEDIINKNNIPFENVAKGFVYNKGEVSLEVVLPKDVDCNCENNNSLVMRGVVDEVKYLFMSDCLKPKEMEIASHWDVRGIDVLKTGHHGYDDATSRKFIKHVDPRVAVITSSDDDSHLEVQKRLESKGTKVYSSSKNGNIKVKRTLGTKSIEVVTDK